MRFKRYIKNLLLHDINMRKLVEKLTVDVGEVRCLLKHQEEQRRVEYLTDRVLNCSERGTSDVKYCEEELVVSLTSYGDRINEVYLAIESVMQGSIKPNRIVLWLSNELISEPLPVTLQKQVKRGLQVEYCDDIRSYKKLIPSLKRFPEACIITIDDDMMYNYDCVENLVRMHNKCPNFVCANRIHKIKLDEAGKPVSYMNWDWFSNSLSDPKLNFPTNGGGTLFPPKVFPKAVFDEDVFMNICKNADDVWFYAMLLMNDVPVVKSFTHAENGCDYLNLPVSQEVSLCQANTNPNQCMNDVQLKAVFDKYDLWGLLSK